MALDPFEIPVNANDTPERKRILNKENAKRLKRSPRAVLVRVLAPPLRGKSKKKST